MLLYNNKNDYIMNILMVSDSFYPNVGGIEIITEILADEFTDLGHIVKIVTMTEEMGNKAFPYEVIRKPPIIQMWQLYNWCDVFVHQQISLKKVWPVFLKRKPWIIVYHQVGWQSGFLGKMKSLFSKFSTKNICVSKTTANGYRLKHYDIIYNAYNDLIFKKFNNKRRRDIIFVGRLSRDKGVYLLIEAFNDFKEKTASDYILNIVGDGVERNKIESFACGTKYAKDIHFLGKKDQSDISKMLNEHRILAVTSTHPYYEAFGIVALEGLACGCIVIGADGDGIEEALHDIGLLYKNGNKKSLCNAFIVAYTMKENEIIERDMLASEWLKTRTMKKVAEEYILLFNKLLGHG